MFLRPQHFQTAQRHTLYRSHLDENWDHHYNWGLHSIELDHDALANHRFVVRSLQARLRDGTLVAVPEDGDLPSVELRGAFDKDNTVTLYLAVPVVNIKRANVSANGPTETGRYVVNTQELEDENTGNNPQPVQVRLLNVKLLLSTQDQAGYEVLPIARIEKSARAEAAPQLDLAYIPPVLACDAWKPLNAGILEQVYDRIGKKQEMLASQVVSRGIGMGGEALGDRLIIEQLRTLNEASSLLGIMAFAQGVHPFLAYLELARLVGRLAIFGRKIGPRAPGLPQYDHDDLGRCFYQAKQYIDSLLDEIAEPDYKERPFEGAGLRMQVTLEPSWLESANQMFVGVKSPLSTEECIRLLTKQGVLDMKIGSSDRVDDIFRMRQRGLMFTPFPNPPRALPAIQGLTYFQINRDSQQEEWKNVHDSLTLAIRLNQNLIEGNIQGQRILRINTGPVQTTLQFTLYVVGRQK
jgi:type VI secretion system protein ImpJ